MATSDAAMIPRVDVLGVGVSVVNLGEAVRQVEKWIDNRDQHYVCVTNVHVIMECQRDGDLLRIQNESGVTLPDGMPLLWAGRYARANGMERVRGSDFLQAVSARAARSSWRCYFYGAGPGTAELLTRQLCERFPDLQIAGWQSPPFRSLTADEDDKVIDQINASSPDILWVGLSAPKQEKWMAEHVGRVKCPVMVGVGAAFDFQAGLVKEAPRWVQSSGFEWLYRLWREPRRLWRRYLSTNPRFALLIIRNRPFLRVSGEMTQ